MHVIQRYVILVLSSEVMSFKTRSIFLDSVISCRRMEFMNILNKNFAAVRITPQFRVTRYYDVIIKFSKMILEFPIFGFVTLRKIVYFIIRF